MIAAQQRTHAQVIDISRDYLGPATERFIDRQITTHLKKNPNNLTKSDIPRLVDWIRIAFGLLTNDTDLVDEYIARLLELSKGKANA